MQEVKSICQPQPPSLFIHLFLRKSWFDTYWVSICIAAMLHTYSSSSTSSRFGVDKNIWAWTWGEFSILIYVRKVKTRAWEYLVSPFLLGINHSREWCYSSSNKQILWHYSVVGEISNKHHLKKCLVLFAHFSRPALWTISLNSC